MLVTPDEVAAYREQLKEIVDGLSAGDPRSGFPHLGAAYTQAQMAMFVEGNVQKRVEKLADALVEIADAFDDLSALIDEYTKQIPLPAYATSSTDAELFLRWLVDSQDVSPEMLDVIHCEQARHEVERLSRDVGIQLARFQELWSPDVIAAEDVDSVVLNPVRVDCVFRTIELLDESWSDELPVTATFYPVSGEIRTALLEPETADILQTLPLTTSIGEIASRLNGGGLQEETMDVILNLNESGLLAIAGGQRSPRSEPDANAQENDLK